MSLSRLFFHFPLLDVATFLPVDYFLLNPSIFFPLNAIKIAFNFLSAFSPSFLFQSDCAAHSPVHAVRFGRHAMIGWVMENFRFHGFVKTTSINFQTILFSPIV
jgi:hypothetical protein